MSDSLFPYSTVKRSTKPIRRGKRPRTKVDERWLETRKKLHKRAHGHCERCYKPAPLHADREFGIPAGEGAHKKRRWNGKKYSLRNLWWSCGGPLGCHQTEHRQEEHDLCPKK